MKKFLKKIILFLIAAILITASTFIIISFSPNLVHRTNIKTTTGGYGASLLRYREAAIYSNVDLVFLGSSHCYRGFDTRIFQKAGISSFNLGSNSQTALNSYYLLKDYYPLLKPKKIILEVYWSTLVSEGVESSIDITSNVPLSLNILQMVILTPSFSPLITWSFEKLHRIKYPLEKEHLRPSIVDEYISGGFVETSRDFNKNANQNLYTNRVIGGFIQLSYIDSINSFCKKNNTELVLICAPVFKNVTSSFSNYKDKMEEINSFAKEQNLQFINFNDKELYDRIDWKVERDWYDNTHLTQKGVEKFNNLLIKEFKIH